MAFIRVARAGEIAPGRTAFYFLESKPIIVANVSGEIFALDGLCPHRNNPLDGATLMDYLIECPYHRFQYDVRTGENHFPRNVYPPDLPNLEEHLRPLRKYSVEVRDGEIWVDAA